MKKNIFKIGLCLVAFTFIACDDEFDNPVEDFQVTSGNADFSRYVAIGNSLTAGFTDNALFISGQQNSYPSIIAGQFAAVSDGYVFTQPLMQDEIGGFANLGIAGKLTLQIVNGSLLPVPTASQTNLDNISAQGPFNNLGVPGAKSFHLLANGYGNPAGLANGTANPYYVRFAPTANASVLEAAAAQQPTFFTLWIGNNDVLAYATSGGAGVDQTGNLNPATYGSNDITDPNVLGASIEAILQTLVVNGGAKGAIANIPNVKDVSYFSVVPYNPLSSSNPAFGAQIPALNAQFAALNGVFDYLDVPERKIVFNENGNSPVVIYDEDLVNLSAQIYQVLIANGLPAAQAGLFAQTYGQSRQATANDLMVFTSSSIIGQVDETRLAELLALGLPQEQAAQLSVSGVTYPLPDQWVLTPQEQTLVENATNAYNDRIRQLAIDYDLAFVNAYAEMARLSSDSGITFYSNTYTTTFVSGGAFSLDGVHLTGKGYSILANMFIRSINTKYGSTIREVLPMNYPGVHIP